MAHAQKTRFRLSAKRTSPFKLAGASVQSTTVSRVVRISGSNAGYTMFRGSVKGTGYPLHSPVSPSLPSRASPCAVTFQLDSTAADGLGRNCITQNCRHEGASVTRYSNGRRLVVRFLVVESALRPL
jgi:hypothetical protein